MSVRQRYALMRWALVQLRRVARRYAINIDNAYESSAKDERGMSLTYRARYGYPWRAALAAEFWWRVEHLGPYRGGDGGLVGRLHRLAYGQRKAAERRGGRV